MIQSVKMYVEVSSKKPTDIVVGVDSLAEDHSSVVVDRNLAAGVDSHHAAALGQERMT